MRKTITSVLDNYVIIIIKVNKKLKTSIEGVCLKKTSKWSASNVIVKRWRPTVSRRRVLYEFNTGFGQISQ